MLGNIGVNQNRGKEEDTQTCMHGRSIGVNKIKRKRKLKTYYTTCNTTFQLKSIINNNLGQLNLTTVTISGW